MDELKPCPFCGGKAVIKQHKNAIDKDNRPFGGWFVDCEDCECGTPWHNTEAEAITVWNRRPAPENKPLTLDQLRQMEGEPVWIEHFDSPCSIKKPGEWLILKTCRPTREHPYIDFKDKGLCAIYYGQGWIAYTRKPEQEDTQK